MWEHEHVFITGAGGRLGRFLAECFLDLGARVTAHHFKSFAHPKAPSVQADLARPEQVEEAWRAACRRGTVTTLILNASRLTVTPIAKKVMVVDDMSLSFESLIAINCLSGWQLARLFQAQAGRHLIIVGDRFAERGMARHSLYGASKMALYGLATELAKTWAPETRVNVVSPGFIDFDGSEVTKPVGAPCLGRVEPSAIFEAIRFLIEMPYVTGEILRVDGGIL